MSSDVEFLKLDSKYFRVSACVYGYQRSLKKSKSFVFLDFGLKERAKGGLYKIYKFYKERWGAFVPFDRFYNCLFYGSLGGEFIKSKKQQR